jgi:hypothetical protein
VGLHCDAELNLYRFGREALFPTMDWFAGAPAGGRFDEITDAAVQMIHDHAGDRLDPVLTLAVGQRAIFLRDIRQRTITGCLVKALDPEVENVNFDAAE